MVELRTKSLRKKAIYQGNIAVFGEVMGNKELPARARELAEEGIKYILETQRLRLAQK